MPNGQITRSTPDNNLNQSGQLAANSVDGVCNAQFLLLDATRIVDPGYWLPWAPFHKGSFEVTGTFVGSVKLKVSNALDQPFNAVQLTVGGTAHTGDVLTATIACDNFFDGVIAASYVVLAGDTLATITAGLLAAINAAINIQRQSLNDTLDVNLAAAIMQAVTGGTDLINVQWSYPLAPISITTGVTGTGATTTLAAAPYDDGSGFDVANSTFTAPGRVSIDECATWIKSTTTAYTSGSITAIVQANLP